ILLRDPVRFGLLRELLLERRGASGLVYLLQPRVRIAEKDEILGTPAQGLKSRERLALAVAGELEEVLGRETLRRLSGEPGGEPRKPVPIREDRDLHPLPARQSPPDDAGAAERFVVGMRREHQQVDDLFAASSRVDGAA